MLFDASKWIQPTEVKLQDPQAFFTLLETKLMMQRGLCVVEMFEYEMDAYKSFLDEKTGASEETKFNYREWDADNYAVGSFSPGKRGPFTIWMDDVSFKMFRNSGEYRAIQLSFNLTKYAIEEVGKLLSTCTEEAFLRDLNSPGCLKPSVSRNGMSAFLKILMYKGIIKPGPLGSSSLQTSLKNLKILADLDSCYFSHALQWIEQEIQECRDPTKSVLSDEDVDRYLYPPIAKIARAYGLKIRYA